MQPKSPSPAPPPIMPKPSGEQSQYDFILNDPAKKKSGLFFGGNSPKQKILFLIIVGGVVLCLILIVFSLVFGGSGGSADLISIARKQTEIIRIAEIGNEKARSSAARNLAVNTSYSVTSARSLVIKQSGKNLKDKDLGLKTTQDINESQEINKDLESAALNNRFDEEFTKIMNTVLSDYQAELKLAYEASSKNTKQVLSDAYNDATLLITVTKPVSS